MFVLNELKKSVKFLEDVAKELEKINNITDIDAYELKAQKVVFNLQMQANQVAGELVPKIMNRRAELQQGNAQVVLANIRALKAELAQKVKEKEDANSDNDTISDAADSGSAKLEGKLPASGQPEHTREEHTDQLVKDGNPGSTDEEQVPVQDLPQKETEVKEKNDRDSDRQLESNPGDRKPKSSKKTR